MSRTRTRVSRALIGLLAVTLTLGLVSYLNKVSRSTATEVVELPADEPVGPPAETKVLVTETPSRPVVQPEAVAEPEEPTTIAMAPAVAAPATSAAPTSSAAVRPIATGSVRPMADGRAKLEAGDLLTARSILNDALLSGRLSAADAAEARTMLQAINQEVILSPRRFANDEFGGTYNVQSGELLSRIAAAHDVTWQFLARINGIDDPRRLRAGQTIKVIQGPFHAIVNKGSFTMDIYLGEPEKPGSLYVTTYRVGLGENDSTPNGLWLVEPQKKLTNPTYYSPRGEGIIHAGDPNNPLGKHWIGLLGLEGEAVGKSSYGIHGTIDPDSIGRQESMGCIRLLNEDVAIVFDMMVEGKSTVLVRD